MAPSCMATVNIFTKGSEAMPMMDDPMIICPVDETGKNSVRPSMMASIIAWRMVMKKMLVARNQLQR